ncbi:sugar ABC transporter ATP-binding protein [Microbacterium allomyrinae]|uniref:Sugar ABC transporter ATP-binding protein n=1 Tax=Microbacterium allomyrinae TaxID=2830666 RepID=A0A9X1LWU0_9MICO|nr:sugar ABC transporter ATP-binding protein [Microbacterium allomyrinae]MCC2033271.1 sugar ABC transporter ATP-binding protein [Microbacterium allomyrinae]
MRDVDTATPTPTRAPTAPILTLTGIGKAFGGAAALRDIDFDVRAGEIHALVGMNGAGKSTLVGVLSGQHTPDDGILTIDGQVLTGLTPRRAREHGIVTVPQKRDLVPTLTIAENLLLGELPRRGGVISWKAVDRAARAALDEVGLDLDPDVLTGTLTAAEQTMVEIAREVRRGGRVLILDEPTASLGGAAAEQVRTLVRRLRAQGTAIIYISHHLDEILDLADRVTVLRDGRRRLTVPVAELDEAALVFAIAGEHVDVERPPSVRTPGDDLLSITGLVVGHRLTDLSLRVRSGEIVAVLGPAGDGQSVLFPALSGQLSPDAGTLDIDGAHVPWADVRAALRSGLRCVTGERLAYGLIPGLSVDENIVLAEDRRARRRWIAWRSLHRRAAAMRERFGVRTIQADPPVSQLSGGNQQKVLLAKWLAGAPRVCFLEDPTNGVDVRAKADIHRLIDALADGGAAVLLASSDVAEVQRLADRVIVVTAGRPTAILDTAETTRDELVALTVGGSARE